VTLVVGCATRDIGFLVSDTLLSHTFQLNGHLGQVNGQFHALKIQIINPSLAVAFAGDDAAASCSLIRELHARINAKTAIDPCEQLFQLASDFAAAPRAGQPPDSDFLVLQLIQGEPKLAKVTRYGVRYCQRAYIGDGGEYKRMKGLQRPYIAPAVQHVQQPDGTFRASPLVLSEGEIEFAEVSNAMEALTHGRRSGSVGAIAGCVTRVVNARISRELEYLQSVEASLTPWEGSSGFSFMASNSGIRGVGIYYRSGEMGFLFIVGDEMPCRKEYASTIDHFIEIARTEYGLNLTGGTWKD